MIQYSARPSSKSSYWTDFYLQLYLRVAKTVRPWQPVADVTRQFVHSIERLRQDFNENGRSAVTFAKAEAGLEKSSST